MSEFKKTIYWIYGILGLAVFMTLGVVAKEVGVIDHMMHFHVDYETMQERAQTREDRRRASEETTREWVKDLNYCGWEQNSFSCDVDHDCNRDR